MMDRWNVDGKNWGERKERRSTEKRKEKNKDAEQREPETLEEGKEQNREKDPSDPVISKDEVIINSPPQQQQHIYAVG